MRDTERVKDQSEAEHKPASVLDEAPEDRDMVQERALWLAGREVARGDRTVQKIEAARATERGTANEDPTRVQAVATAGVAGAGGVVPHYDRIQASFGRHDVSHVQAHVGGDAATATRAIGAEAYATGNDVAFASAPDLHTSAHEAAHVVQQQRGVQLKGGVGQAGDAHERHADAVADAVVAGRSAEPLLDAISPSSASTTAVQRKEVTANDLLAPETLPDTKGADARTIVRLINLYVGAALRAQAKGLEMGLASLSKPPPVEDESVGKQIVLQFAGLGMSMALGTLGDTIVTGLQRWAKASKDDLVGDIIASNFEAFASALQTGATAFTSSRANDTESGQAHGGNEPAQRITQGSFDALREYRAQMENKLAAVETKANATLIVLENELLAAPPDSLQDLVTSLAFDEGQAAQVTAAQQRGTMFGWMNCCSGLALGPKGANETVMPHANEMDPEGRSQDDMALWQQGVPGFVDIHLSVPETIDGTKGIELDEVIVNSHPEVADMLKQNKMPLTTVPVHRKVFINLFPAFVVTQDHQLEMNFAHWMLEAIGSGRKVNASEFMSADAEEDASAEQEQTSMTVDVGGGTHDERRKRAERKASHAVEYGTAAQGMRKLYGMLSRFTTAKAKAP